MKRRLVGLALLALLAEGCELAPDTDTALGPAVAIPPAILASRAVDRNRLAVELSVDGAPVPTFAGRDGQRYAELSLTDDTTLRAVKATWQYDMGDGTYITLAVSDTMAVGLDAPGSLVIDSYDSERFDADFDGASNLAEIDADRDPRFGGDAAPLPVVGADQGDCRTIGRDEIPLTPPLPPASRPPTVFTFDGPLDDILLIEPEPIGVNAFHAVLSVVTYGNFSVEHVGGLPLDTDYILYERNDPRAESRGEKAFDAKSDSTQRPLDGLRARVPERPTTSSPLAPGVYCYALFARPADGSDEYPPLLDATLRLRFEPRDEAS